MLLANCSKEKIVIEFNVQPVLMVSAKNLSISYLNNSTSVLEVASNIDWTATVKDSWLSLSAASGKGNLLLNLTAAENNSTNSRSTTVAVKGANVAEQTVMVTQVGAQLFLDVSKAEFNFTSAAPGTINFDVTSNTSWTISCDQTWLSFPSASGTGNSSIAVTSEENKNYTERTATLKVLANGLPEKNIRITQAAAAVTTDSKPNWQLASNTNFAYSMTVIAKINLLGTVTMPVAGDEFAAFSGTECRGAATIIEGIGVNADETVFFLLIKGEQSANEPLTFKFYQKSSSHIFTCEFTTEFIANQALGTVDEPYIFSIK